VVVIALEWPLHGSSSSCPANQHKPDLSLCRVLGLLGVCLAGSCVL